MIPKWTYSWHVRGVILELASELCLPVCEKRVTLAELHCADEVFTTGTMGEV